MLVAALDLEVEVAEDRDRGPVATISIISPRNVLRDIRVGKPYVCGAVGYEPAAGRTRAACRLWSAVQVGMAWPPRRAYLPPGATPVIDDSACHPPGVEVDDAGVDVDREVPTNGRRGRQLRVACPSRPPWLICSGSRSC